MENLSRIVDELGGQTATAKVLGIKQQNIQYHLGKGVVPADWVLTLSDATGIPCWEIRPDLYPPERFKKAA